MRYFIAIEEDVYFAVKTYVVSLRFQEREIHYDHMVPLEQGGMNDVTNIQLLCSSCNLSKGTFSATSNIYQNWYDMNKG